MYFWYNDNHYNDKNTIIIFLQYRIYEMLVFYSRKNIFNNKTPLFSLHDVTKRRDSVGYTNILHEGLMS